MRETAKRQLERGIPRLIVGAAMVVALETRHGLARSAAVKWSREILDALE